MDKVKLLRNDIDIFKKLQLTPYELGGKIHINTLATQKSPIRNLKLDIKSGKNRSINSRNFPSGILWFHTHPSFPSIKHNETIHSKVLKQLKRKKNDFTIDILVSPISDDDLVSVTHAIHQQRTCSMAVFCPEGIYIMSLNPNSNPSKKNSIEEKNVQFALNTIEITHCSKLLKNKASKFILNRDAFIISEQKKLIHSLNNEKDHDNKIKILDSFQKRIGIKMCKLVQTHYKSPIGTKIHPLKVEYYPWDQKYINISSGVCNLDN